MTTSQNLSLSRNFLPDLEIFCADHLRRKTTQSDCKSRTYDSTLYATRRAAETVASIDATRVFAFGISLPECRAGCHSYDDFGSRLANADRPINQCSGCPHLSSAKQSGSAMLTFAAHPYNTWRWIHSQTCLDLADDRGLAYFDLDYHGVRPRNGSRLCDHLFSRGGTIRSAVTRG